jgi:hypothetical protein
VIKLGYSRAFTYTMSAGIVWSIWTLASSRPPFIDAVLLVAFSLIVTDLISGILHVVLDNPRSLELPSIRALAEGFQRHHENPTGIYEMPLYQHIYVMHMPLTLLFVAVLPFQDAGMHVVFLSMVLAIHVMQMAHLWAHLPAERVPRLVGLLHRSRLLIGKRQHDLHHRAPFDKDFCIMSGICNRPLNAGVALIGATSHWWLAIFLLAAVSPLVAALVVARF